MLGLPLPQEWHRLPDVVAGPLATSDLLGPRIGSSDKP